MVAKWIHEPDEEIIEQAIKNGFINLMTTIIECLIKPDIGELVQNVPKTVKIDIISGETDFYREFSDSLYDQFINIDMKNIYKHSICSKPVRGPVNSNKYNHHMLYNIPEICAQTFAQIIDDVV